jgi:hypothetical protein
VQNGAPLVRCIDTQQFWSVEQNNPNKRFIQPTKENLLFPPTKIYGPFEDIVF